MPRAKTGFSRTKRHKKILKSNKGFWGARGKLFRIAHAAFIRAGEHAFKGRREKKRDFRTLWIQRINAGLEQIGVKYNVFAMNLKNSKVILNRKMLAQIAYNDLDSFKKVVETINKK